jgi:CRP/FNR family transcriptional regulator, cyclic AMP receptor protein
VSIQVPARKTILNRIDSDALSRILKKSFGPDRTLEYPGRVGLFRQGSEAQSVYFVHSGLVKLVCLDHSGKQVIVGLRGPGWLLGSVPVMLQKPYATAAETVCVCQLIRISASEFDRLIRSSPKFSLYLHQLHAQEVHEHLKKLVNVASRRTQQNLIDLLQDLTCAFGSPKNAASGTLDIPLKQWEIAELLAVTPEHLSRMLRTMKRNGLLFRRKNMLVIRDVERLRTAIETASAESGL